MGESAHEVELSAQGRRLRVDGREVPPRAYQGRLEVIVYSTERLKVIRGPMRERRQYVDRAAMFIVNSNDVIGDGPGLQSVAMAMGMLCFRSRSARFLFL